MTTYAETHEPIPLSPPSWLYLKVYPGRLELVDATLRDVIRPWVTQYLPRVRRWFFLRYFDSLGPHIRLRLLMDPDDSDQAASSIPWLIERIASMDGGLPLVEYSSPGAAAVRQTWDTEHVTSDVLLDLYEPELAKWGGAEFIPVAEELFQFSSEVATILVDLIPPGWRSRIATGTSVILATIQALDLSPAYQLRFLATHFAWWSGSTGTMPPEHVQALRDLAIAEGPSIIAELQRLRDESTFGAVIDEFAVELDRVLSRCNPEQQRLFLVFHHLHLMLNRLGVIPAEEALASLVAAEVIAREDPSAVEHLSGVAEQSDGQPPPDLTGNGDDHPEEAGP
jgi:thiopeptide-type bacteriocin biosynthesis protein